LRENGNEWMTTREIADAVNEAKRYRRRQPGVVTAFQIHERTKNYEDLFERKGSRVRLRSWDYADAASSDSPSRT